MRDFRGETMKSLKRRTFRSIATIFIAIGSMTVSTAGADASLFGPSSDYIVKITPETQAAVEKAIKSTGGQVNSRFQYAFNGFVIKLPDALIPVLKRIPNILTVEKDAPVSGLAIQQTQTPTPAWGLDRIDQREAISTTAGYQGSYGYRSGGAGATVYIGDTGIFPHSDLTGRIGPGFSGISDGNGTVDCNGHGTHVATNVAGTKYGVAKNATVVPVRILGCGGMGSFATVIAGLDWILSPANTNSKTQAVVNLSIGGNASTSVNDAILKLTNAGITVVAAAGNDNIDACKVSPASAPSAITVGAVTSGDAKAGFSNWGSCVDINAPGVGITAGWWTGADATLTASGTSMATPHVAGAAAVFLGLNPGASVAQVSAALVAQATSDAIIGLGNGTPNKLLYVSPTDGGPAILPPAIQVKTVTTVSHQSANVVVEINPGNAPTTAEFQYSRDQSFATGTTSINLSPSPLVGGDIVSIPLTLESLTASSTYYFRSLATNESGSFTTATGTFKTIAPPVSAPTVTAKDPLSVTGWSARLTGTVNANNGSTNVYFVYGTDPDFLTKTQTGTAAQISVGGSSTTGVHLDISFLTGSTTYYYKVVAGNSVASVSSNVISFTTPAIVGVMPTVETIRPTGGLNSPTTTVTGRINPNGQTTTVRLVYGMDQALLASPKIITLPIQYTGIETVTVSADMTGIVPGYRYYYRFEALNAAGITKPTPLTNTGNPVAPVINSTTATNVTLNSMTLNASVNAGAGNLRFYFVYGTDPLLETGTVTVNATPFAITNATTQNVTAAIANLKSGTTYYFRVKMYAYSGPLTETGGWGFGPIARTNTPYPPRLAQTVTLTMPSERFFGGVATPLVATSSSGLPVDLYVQPASVCKIEVVDSQSVLTYVSPVGSASRYLCNVTAVQNGDSTYEPAQISRPITFLKENTAIKATWAGALNETGTVVDFVVSSISQPTLKEDISGTTAMVVTSRTPNICVVDSVSYQGSATSHTRATVHSLWNGTCHLMVTYAGNSYWLSSGSSVVVAVSGMKSPLVGANAPQNISFTTPANRSVGTLNPLTVRASSGLPVTLTSLTPTVCSIVTAQDGSFAAQSADGLSGDSNLCRIQATQAGDDRWAPAAPSIQSFNWIRKAQAITFTLPTTRFFGGAPTALTASSTSGLPVEFRVTTPAVCAITVADGQSTLSYLTPLPTGSSASCGVTALQSGDSTWSPAPSIARTIVWQKESTNITGAWVGNITESGTVLDLIATSASQPLLKESLAGTTPFTVTSLSKNVCTVESVNYVGSATSHTQVVVKALWNGSCTLQVSFAGNSYWLAKSQAILKTVSGIKTPQAGANASQSITLSIASVAEFGQLLPITTRATSGLPVTVTSTTPLVCEVITNANGSFSAKNVDGLTGDNNNCVLAASQAGNESWAAARSVTATTKFRRNSQMITFSLPGSRYFGGAPTTLSATAKSGLPITYTTSTPAVCAISTVDTATVLSYLTPLPVGNSVACSVTASQTGNEKWMPAATVTRTFTWMKEPTAIKWLLAAPVNVAGVSADISVFSSVQPKLGELNGGTTPLEITSMTPRVCVVSDASFQGTSTSHTRVTLKAIWNGACQVTVKFAGNSYWLPSTTTLVASVTGVTTPQEGANASQAISFSSISNRDYASPLTLGAVATSKYPITYTSLTPSTCIIVQAAGANTVQPAQGVSGSGVTCTIQASQAGDTRWAAAPSVTRSFQWMLTPVKLRITNAVSTRVGAGPFTIIASSAFFNSVLNGGKASVDLPVTVTTSTPAVCSVLSTSPLVNTSGTFTQASIRGVTNGLCTTTWSYAGDALRAPATLVHSFTITGVK
jgi:subtilisin family serine protease/phosphodiesterase/alkaline phosphatase D-like protein